MVPVAKSGLLLTVSRRIVWLIAPILLAGCALPRLSKHADTAALTGAWADASTFGGATVLMPWEHYVLPAKQATLFSAQRIHGRDTLKAHAQSSASMVRRKLRIEPEALGMVQFSWLVESLIADADMGDRDTDDAPVRIVLAFEGDRSKFSGRNAMLSELAHALTGEPMPYATLMYSWCMHCAPGQTIINPRTDRIRTHVVETGSHALGRWRDYVRDVRADFMATFGEPPGALVAVGMMTDADNTGSDVKAWYGPVVLGPAKLP